MPRLDPFPGQRWEDWGEGRWGRTKQSNEQSPVVENGSKISTVDNSSFPNSGLPRADSKQILYSIILAERAASKLISNQHHGQLRTPHSPATDCRRELLQSRRHISTTDTSSFPNRRMLKSAALKLIPSAPEACPFFFFFSKKGRLRVKAALKPIPYQNHGLHKLFIRPPNRISFPLMMEREAQSCNRQWWLLHPAPWGSLWVAAALDKEGV